MIHHQNDTRTIENAAKSAKVSKHVLFSSRPLKRRVSPAVSNFVMKTHSSISAPANKRTEKKKGGGAIKLQAYRSILGLHCC